MSLSPELQPPLNEISRVFLVFCLLLVVVFLHGKGEETWRLTAPDEESWQILLFSPVTWSLTLLPEVSIPEPFKIFKSTYFWQLPPQGLTPTSRLGQHLLSSIFFYCYCLFCSSFCLCGTFSFDPFSLSLVGFQEEEEMNVCAQFPMYLPSTIKMKMKVIYKLCCDVVDARKIMWNSTQRPIIEAKALACY